MGHQPFIVRVQDIGEIYEYGYTTLQAAQYLMSIERLPCSLWVFNQQTGGYDGKVYIYSHTPYSNGEWDTSAANTLFCHFKGIVI